MKSVTRAEMQALDQKAIREYAIPSLLLMENAGRGAAEFLCSQLGYRGLAPLKGPGPSQRILILCGKGNNGGDGFVVARHLWNRGFQVQNILLSEPSGLSGDPKINFEIAGKMKIPYKVMAGPESSLRLRDFCRNSDILVDAVFGIGLERPAGGFFLDAIRSMNDAAKPVLAVDIPSGLDADTGEPMPEAVKAMWTATMGLPKKGFFTDSGKKYTGRVAVIDIGLPGDLLSA